MCGNISELYESIIHVIIIHVHVHETLIITSNLLFHMIKSPVLIFFSNTSAFMLIHDYRDRDYDNRR